GSKGFSHPDRSGIRSRLRMEPRGPELPSVPGIGPAIKLHHGTTRHRAEAIRKDGPDPRFKGPGEQISEPAFYMARPEGPFTEGNPIDCAEYKAELFWEGGPAVLEVDVPAAILAKAMDLVAEVVFGPGYGLRELCDAWPSLKKRVLLIKYARGMAKNRAHS